MPYAVNLMDKEQMAMDISKAKEVSDFVVVCPHWGTEYVLNASSYQKDYAQFFLENGVDLVIGTHPHVIEPVEMLKDDEGEVIIDSYAAHPLVTYVSGNKKTISVFPMDMFNDNLAQKSFTQKLDTDFGKSYLEEIWESVMNNTQ